MAGEGGGLGLGLVLFIRLLYMALDNARSTFLEDQLDYLDPMLSKESSLGISWFSSCLTCCGWTDSKKSLLFIRRRFLATFAISCSGAGLSFIVVLLSRLGVTTRVKSERA